MSDLWLPGWPGNFINFYDLTEFNSDTVEVRKMGEFMPSRAIAEFYFRVDVDKIKHSRIVFGFMDWLGAIGGVERALLKIIGFFIGGYIQFHSNIELINQQYKKGERKEGEEQESPGLKK